MIVGSRSALGLLMAPQCGTRFLENNTFTSLYDLTSLKKNILSHSSSRSLKQNGEGNIIN